MRVKTTDIYRAAFYTMHGALLDGVDKRSIAHNDAKRRGYKNEYVLYLTDVPEWAITMYDQEQTFGSIRDYIRSRKRLKTAIKKLVA